MKTNALKELLFKGLSVKNMKMNKLFKSFRLLCLTLV